MSCQPQKWIFESRSLASRAFTRRFSTASARGLDHYPGFEFELHHKANGAEPLVAGGRYDGLMTQLGSGSPIPAVGFSIWIDALLKAGENGGKA